VTVPVGAVGGDGMEAVMETAFDTKAGFGVGATEMVGLNFCWKITWSVAVTSFENVGLETVAFSNAVLLATGDEPTLIVRVTESVTALLMLVVRVHCRVPSVQFQLLVGSLIAVAVRPAGSVMASAADGSTAVFTLVLVTAIVTCSVVSLAFTTNGLGLKAMDSVGTTIG
jgi:hypothetical protein